MATHQLLYVVLATVTLLGCHVGHVSTASPCHGLPQPLIVDYKPQKIYSPGYPDNYDNNLRCEWLLEAGTNHRPGFGIQLATLQLQLDPIWATRVGECDDYLELFEGVPGNLGPSLARWCGQTLKVIKSMATSLTLRFSTNGRYTGKGFVLEYALVRVASAECLPGRATPVHIGRAPLYETFQVQNSESRCTWTVEAITERGDPDHGSSLVIEAFSLPNTFCSSGSFLLYDGPSSSSPKILEWCGTGSPFSTVYLSSSHATLTFTFVEGQELISDIDPITLKLYSRSNNYECNDTYVPSIDVGLHPVYFSLPFSTSSSGTACKAHVSQRVRDSVRLDVIGVRGQETNCRSDIITVRQASTDVEVETTCNSRGYPMYLPLESDLLVVSKSPPSRVYLRAMSTDDVCSGRVVDAQAYDSVITERTLPTDSQADTVQNNCYSKFLITTKDEGRVISLRLQWRLQHGGAVAAAGVAGAEACSGDFVQIYDGFSVTDRLLFSSCRQADMLDAHASVRLFSTQRQILILFNADDTNMAPPLNVQFFSIPAGTHLCEGVQELTVDRVPQNLSSLNYPISYPLDYTCTYRLTANDSDHVVVVETADTHFVPGCGDILTIYHGMPTAHTDRWSTQTDQLLARICGDDLANKKYVSQHNEVMVKFISNKSGPNIGGWRLLVHTQARSTGPGNRASLLLFYLAPVLAFLVVFRI